MGNQMTKVWLLVILPLATDILEIRPILSVSGYPD